MTSGPGSSRSWESSWVRISRLAELNPFITADGSQIREIVGPSWTDARNQSLAEATINSGEETLEHYHPSSEELYYFVAGTGRMRLGDTDESEVVAGDCVVIPPGTPHKLWNTGTDPLVLLCCCSPAYSDDDTVMTGR
jgi:mannose-6-phosphate isomerase-like protein (cupin superfamily)